MRASVAFFVLAFALITINAQARTLKQGVFTPPVLNPPVAPTSAASPWANFTRDPNSLFIAIKILNSTVTGSDQECAVLCNEDQQCEYFAWCPTNMTNGCGIPAANATYSSVVPPGGCIMSCDDVRNRTAIFVAFGKSVPFVSGEFSPQQNTSAGTAAPSDGSSTAGGGNGGGSGGISPMVRKLMQGGSGGSSNVWSNYTQEQNRFNQGIDGLPATAAQTAEECATACNNDPNCEFWSLCPPAAGTAGCEVPSFTPNASPTAVPAGTCLLSFDGTRDQAAYFLMLGQAVAFEAGKWNGSSASNPTTPGTAPSVVVPTIPGLVTNATGPSSNISAPGSTPIPFVPPLSGNASSSDTPSNGTLPSRATNSSSVLIYTSWVRAFGSGAAYCNVYNGTAFVSSESLGNGFLASGGNGTISLWRLREGGLSALLDKEMRKPVGQRDAELAHKLAVECLKWGLANAEAALRSYKYWGRIWDGTTRQCCSAGQWTAQRLAVSHRALADFYEQLVQQKAEDLAAAEARRQPIIAAQSTLHLELPEALQQAPPRLDMCSKCAQYLHKMELAEEQCRAIADNYRDTFRRRGQLEQSAPRAAASSGAPDGAAAAPAVESPAPPAAAAAAAAAAGPPEGEDQQGQRPPSQQQQHCGGGGGGGAEGAPTTPKQQQQQQQQQQQLLQQHHSSEEEQH